MTLHINKHTSIFIKLHTMQDTQDNHVNLSDADFSNESINESINCNNNDTPHECRANECSNLDTAVENNVTDTGATNATQTHIKHHEEMKRRVCALQQLRDKGMSGSMSGGFEEPPNSTEGVNLPFKRHDQAWIVFSTCHIGVPPLTTRVEDAGLRLYGVFATSEEANMYAHELVNSDPDCNVQIGKTHDWILAANSIGKLESVDYMHTKSQLLIVNYTEKLTRASNEFKSYTEDPDANRPPVEQRNKIDEIPHACTYLHQDKEHNNETQHDKEQTSTKKLHKIYTRRFDRNLEIRDQNLAVISIIHDNDKSEGEFVFSVWGVFATDAECDGWIRCVASNNVCDHAMHVVSMYQWVRPAVMSDEYDDSTVPIHYRSKELNNIMQHANQHVKDISSFKKWCTENETSEPSIIIE